MIFDSLGFGEVLVILALALALVPPKDMARFMKSLAKWRGKVNNLQGNLRGQFDKLLEDDERQEAEKRIRLDKTEMRRWGREQVRLLPAAARAEAAKAMTKEVGKWDVYHNAKVVAAFCGTLDEVDTEALLRRILADGKTLLLPYVEKDLPPSPPPDPVPVPGTASGTAPGTGSEPREAPPALRMRMAAVFDLKADLAEGAYRILEPRAERRRDPAPPEPDLVFVPGACFDTYGGRVGKGLGFYDRYLGAFDPMRLPLRVGLAFDAQISRKKLALEAHDQPMDYLVSERGITSLLHAEVT